MMFDGLKKRFKKFLDDYALHLALVSLMLCVIMLFVLVEYQRQWYYFLLVALTAAISIGVVREVADGFTRALPGRRHSLAYRVVVIGASFGQVLSLGLLIRWGHFFGSYPLVGWIYVGVCVVMAVYSVVQKSPEEQRRRARKNERNF